MTRYRNLQFILILFSFLLFQGCQMSSQEKMGKLSEVEQMYVQQRYTDAMNVARFNLNKDPKDLASIATVWKVQVLQEAKTLDYAQQFYEQAKERVREYGPGLIPYMGRGLQGDHYNTVRLFCLYALGEFDDSTATQLIASVFEPDYTLGDKASNVTLDFIRGEAATALANRHYKPAFEGIAALLKSEDTDTRIKAVSALGFIGDQRAIPLLEELAKESLTQKDIAWMAIMADSSIARIKRQ